MAIIAGWYVLFFSPLSEQMAATTAKIASERKRVATASEIEQLKKALAPYQGRIPAGADVNELMQHVIAQMRVVAAETARPEARKAQGPRSLSRRWASS